MLSIYDHFREVFVDLLLFQPDMVRQPADYVFLCASAFQKGTGGDLQFGFVSEIFEKLHGKSFYIQTLQSVKGKRI